jgi:branched-chain amino acid transport system permease protein
MLLFGLGMVLIMIWKPRGLIATREPSILLHRDMRAVRSGTHAAAGLLQDRA